MLKFSKFGSWPSRKTQVVLKESYWTKDLNKMRALGHAIGQNFLENFEFPRGSYTFSRHSARHA